MIQRIQTVYLILVAGILSAMLFFAQTSGIEPVHKWILSSLCASSGLLAVVTIFLYKHRLLQIKLCYPVLVASIVLLSYIGFYFNLFGIKYMLFPAVSLLLTALAIWAIRKDDKLVKSLDRLR